MNDENLTPDAVEMDYEPDLITLEDENGREHTFEVLDAAALDDQRYLAVVPYSENAEDRLGADAEMLIMRIGEEDGEEYLDIVDDENELQSVGQMFLNRLSDVYNIDLESLEGQLDSED